MTADGNRVTSFSAQKPQRGRLATKSADSPLVFEVGIASSQANGPLT